MPSSPGEAWLNPEVTNCSDWPYVSVSVVQIKAVDNSHPYHLHDCGGTPSRKVKPRVT